MKYLKSQLHHTLLFNVILLLGCLSNDGGVNSFHLGDAVLVDNSHVEIGEIDDESLLDLLDTLDHEVVGLLPGHVRSREEVRERYWVTLVSPVVSVQQSRGEEPSVAVGSKVGLTQYSLSPTQESLLLTLIMLAR